MAKKVPKLKKPPKFSLKRASMQMEPLSNAGPEREACKLCARYGKGNSQCQTPVVPEGWTGKLLIVRQGDEGSDARYLLRKLWRRAGWKDEDVATVPAIRCNTGKEVKMVQVRACRPFLLKAIDVLKPKYVLGLGSIAQRALRNAGEENIKKNRGRKLEVPYAQASPSP